MRRSRDSGRAALDRLWLGLMGDRRHRILRDHPTQAGTSPPPVVITLVPKPFRFLQPTQKTRPNLLRSASPANWSRAPAGHRIPRR
jgi:hypothetical protein